MTAIAAIALVGLIVWFAVNWRRIPRRWCRDLDLHDWRSQPGTGYDACQCGATRPKVTP
jgi:hypothetical protein